MSTSKENSMKTLSLKFHEIRTAVDGRILQEGASDQIYSAFISDSRKIEKDCIFLCIAGNKVDGHDFASQAADSGAALIIGQNETKLRALENNHPRVGLMLVKDALRATQALATYYRSKFEIPVIGLTGSSGKTTTKDLIASIANVSNKDHTLITEGTLNNHWGVPQMILRLNQSHRAAVLEMGMSDFGEIQSLAAIGQPTIGYITAIGPAHLEKLGSVEGVLRAKRELFDWINLHQTKGQLLFNIDDPLLAKLHSEIKTQCRLSPLTLSLQSEADFQLLRCSQLDEDGHFGWHYEIKTPNGTIEGTLPLPGKHNLTNALAAVALTLVSGIAGKNDIKAGLAKPKISSLRSELFRSKHGATIYNDSYNANPTSVGALFDTAHLILENFQGRYDEIIAAVGDMLELGPTANELHRDMGRKAAESGVTTLLALGHHREHWADGFQNTGRKVECRTFQDHESLYRDLQHRLELKPRALVLVKGSRGAKMDLVASQLKAK